MAWDPNEKGSWAWFTKEACEHGGVEPYINAIEENARAEAHEADKRSLLWIVPTVALGGALLKTAYDKVKQQITMRNELKRKSDAAKETLICGANIVSESETTSTEEENAKG